MTLSLRHWSRGFQSKYWYRIHTFRSDGVQNQETFLGYIASAHHSSPISRPTLKVVLWRFPSVTRIKMAIRARLQKPSQTMSTPLSWLQPLTAKPRCYTKNLDKGRGIRSFETKPMGQSVPRHGLVPVCDQHFALSLCLPDA